MHPRLAEILAYTEHARAELLAVVAAVIAEHHARVPAGGGWSIEEVLHHLYLVEHSSVRAIFRALKRAREGGAVAREGDASSLLARVAAIESRMAARRFEAPAFTRPQERLEVPALLGKLAESREGLRTWAREADGIALDTIHFPHPALGEISLYDWVIMIGAHERHHTRQIEAISNAVAS